MEGIISPATRDNIWVMAAAVVVAAGDTAVTGTDTAHTAHTAATIHLSSP